MTMIIRYRIAREMNLKHSAYLLEQKRIRSRNLSLISRTKRRLTTVIGTTTNFILLSNQSLIKTISTQMQRIRASCRILEVKQQRNFTRIKKPLMRSNDTKRIKVHCKTAQISCLENCTRVSEVLAAQSKITSKIFHRCMTI